jgi:predicted O-methyltransferase YrrM
VIATEHLAAIRTAFREDNTYLSYCSDPVRTLLHEIIEHPWFPGVTDPPALALIGAFLRILQPERVLQLGTYIGFSALYFADLLVRNPRPGHLVTVEPSVTNHDAARLWAVKAGLEHAIHFFDGKSTEDWVGEELAKRGPFDLIYIDSSHRYGETMTELARMCAPGGWLSERGIILVHDVTEWSAQLAPDLEGGVRRAFLEWSATNQSHFQTLILEPPLWPNNCGLGMIIRRSPANQVVSEEHHQKLAAKEARIAELEAQLKRLESNRFIRWLDRFQPVSS